MAAKPEVIEAQAKLASYRITGKHLLTGIESQKSYIAYLHFLKTPCWSCAEPSNYLQAVGEDYDPNIYRGEYEKYACPHCGVEMIYVVPFFAGAAPWLWGNPKIYREKKKEET